MNTRRKERKQLETRIADCILDNTCGRIAQWTEEARLTIKTSAEAEVEDINNKVEEDSKEEDSMTKAEALTAVEEDSKEEVSNNNKAVDMEEAEATSIQMTSTSNSQ